MATSKFWMLNIPTSKENLYRKLAGQANSIPYIFYLYIHASLTEHWHDIALINFKHNISSIVTTQYYYTLTTLTS